MALNNNLDPQVKGILKKEILITAAATDLTKNTIPAGASLIRVTGVTTDANDYIVLPRLGSVSIGKKIIIICGAGANFEMRTPATSAEEINSEDCDGTKEYLCTDTEIVEVYKIDNTIGWMALGYTAIGAKATAVIPD
jgi:hypothetical protein